MIIRGVTVTMRLCVQERGLRSACLARRVSAPIGGSLRPASLLPAKPYQAYTIMSGDGYGLPGVELVGKAGARRASAFAK